MVPVGFLHAVEIKSLRPGTLQRTDVVWLMVVELGKSMIQEQAPAPALHLRRTFRLHLTMAEDIPWQDRASVLAGVFI